MRKRRRGYNGRRGQPRRKKVAETSAPVIPMPRVATGPTTPEQRAKHQNMLDLIARTHEEFERRDAQDAELERRLNNTPAVPGAVQFGGAATEDFRQALDGGADA
jgi:hypothetical protein